MSAAEHRNIAAADALMGIMGFRRALAPHQERVVAERQELDVKIKALEQFVDRPGKPGSPIFAKLPARERGLLYEQHSAMSAYLDILDQRIEAFHA